MAYGLSPRAPVASGFIDQAAKANANRSAPRSWSALSEACRLAVIEQALRPANDVIDGFPAAL